MPNQLFSSRDVSAAGEAPEPDGRLTRKGFLSRAGGAGALMLGGAGLLGACGGSSSSSGGSSSSSGGSGTRELHLAAVNNLTGSGAFYGTGTQRCEQLLVQRINAAGGFKDPAGHTYKIRISYFDMGDSRESAVAATRSAGSDESVAGIISPGSDLGWLSMLPLCGDLKLPLVIPSDGSAVSHWNPYAFRIDADASHGFKAFLSTYVAKLGIDRVGLIYDTQFPSVAFEGSLWKDPASEQRYGYHLVGVETFRTGDTDFSSQLTALKAANPMWMMVVAQPPEMIKIINQAASMGISAKLYGSFGSNDTTTVWQGTQGKVKGSYFYAPGVPAKGLMRDPTPYNLYVQKYKDVPIIFHIFGWDAVNIFVDAVKRAGTSTDREKIRAALGNTNGFPLATSGTVTWHNPPTGENLTPPVVLGVVTGPGTAKLIPA